MKKPHFTHPEESIPVRLGHFEFTKQGIRRFDWRDPYHFAVSIPWIAFVAAISVMAIATHLAFASLYWIRPDSIANAKGFLDDFFFSVETLATVGYGVFSPTTLYGHIVASVEIYTGLGETAMVTGLIFVRFSRPKGKLLFADNPVITRVNGVPNLMLRLGNGGVTTLVAADAGMHLIVMNASEHSAVIRELHDLKLVRDHLPLFPLIWMLRHVIDETSPLHGMTTDEMSAADVRLFATCSAYDRGLGARIYGMRNYTSSEVLFGRRYQDVVKIDGEGRATVDYSRLHLVETETGDSTVKSDNI